MLVGLLAWHAFTLSADDRQVRDTTSPSWLFAVGKLTVPGTRLVDGRRKHHVEDCSATLLPSPAGDRSDTLVTAWHCLALKPRTVTFSDRDGQPISREVYRLASGGGMHADWALLRLFRPLPVTDVPALPVHPGQAGE